MSHAQQTAANKQLYDSINTNWQQQNNSQLLALINNRLQTNSNDILGLILKAHYYVFCQKDIPQSHQAANAFLTAVKAATSKKTFQDQAQVLANISLNIPTSENTPLTPAAINEIHTNLPNFPFIDDSFVLWGQITGQIK
jgi:hypothetical protein